MAQELKLKVSEEPTIFNKEMVIGTLLAPVIGTIIGGIIGKNRMAHDLEQGKTVSDKPSFFNKDMLLGALAGSALGGIAGNVAAIAAVAVGTPVIGAAGLLIAATAGVAGLVLGAVIGGKYGQSSERHEFAEAQQQEQNQNQSQGQSRGQTVEFNNPEVAVGHLQNLQARVKAAGHTR